MGGKSSEADGEYYIYGLTDPHAARETRDPMLSIFYIGKGRQTRWEQHEKDALKVLARDDPTPERRGSKAERIRQIHDRGEHVGAVRLSGGYLSEKDAYRAESLAIDTVGALLAAAGRPPLTNATPGHHAGFVWLREHYVYVTTEELDIGAPPADDGSERDGDEVEDLGAGDSQEILVKGTPEALAVPPERRAELSALPAELDGPAREGRIEPKTVAAGDDAAWWRRGWDPQDPWTDEEARDRARRYWPLARDRVAAWLAGDEPMPTHLLLGIPSARGQTVVRYAWRIDPGWPWQYYVETGRWGIPLGPREYEHPRLGRALYEIRGDRRVQVLAGYSAGIRVLPAQT